MARAIDNILLRSWLKPQPTFYEGGGSSHRQHFQKVVARAIDQHFKGLWIDINQFQWVWLCSSHSLHFTKLVARAIDQHFVGLWIDINQSQWVWLCSKGSDRLTCTAQPGHGGKRSGSPEGRVTSAKTEPMQVIDHEPNYLNEIQYNITQGTREWLGQPGNAQLWMSRK